MIVGFTGHRPAKLGGFILPNPTYISICQRLESILKELEPEKAISGMALGLDQWAANVCIKLGIPFIAAIPFAKQGAVWPDEAKRIYNIILARAESHTIVSDGGYSADKLQIRNEWIVDNCDVLIAVWDGSKSGTGNCVEYAKKLNKQIIRIEP